MVFSKILIIKVLITSRCNHKILGCHFLVHEGCVIMMFNVPQEPKMVTQNFMIATTGEKYFKKSKFPL